MEVLSINRSGVQMVALVLFAWALPANGLLAASIPERLLISADKLDGTDVVQLQDAELELVQRAGQTWLALATGHTADWPGITLKAPAGPWDLSRFQEIVLDVKNTGDESLTVHCRVDCPGGDGDKNSLTEKIQLQPQQTEELVVRLRRRLTSHLEEKLFGMRGYPGGRFKSNALDVSRITQLIIFVHKPPQDQAFQFGNIRARGKYTAGDWLTMSAEEFFPMIDRYGQFKHKQWPGKTISDAALQQSMEREQEDLAKHAAPEQWNQYGGWKRGPQMEATGHFYPKKIEGKWWLIDPEGRLFWSHGVDCVGFSQGTTPITDREFYYAHLPEEDSPLAVFYGTGSWAPHGYYKDKGTYRTFNFAGANLWRKYGQDWREKASQLIHQRLSSWGMNTIANWSDSNVYLMRKTPYVVSTGSGGSKRIEGSSGYWGKFPDPFDPSFRAALDRRMHGEIDRSANDPWCIGYFVDNELAWGDELSLAQAALQSPPDQAAKQAFMADLKQKYGTIDALNQAWQVSHESWEALASCREAADETLAEEDLGAFYSRIAAEYFRHCRAAVKQVAPHNLYLGCRFAWVNDRGARVAADYCDVVGYNLYRDSVADFALPSDVDMPVIIGEFHFGALDRGMFHTGLRPTSSQQQRADAYRNYVTGALKNPCLVGSHWFQYGDQATTGRGDGENYQIGLVDICDRPYPETIAAVRQMGNSLYTLRYKAAVEAESPSPKP